MGFTEGFTQGFGLIDGVMRKNRAEERQARLDEVDNERYQDKQQMNESQLALQKEQVALQDKQFKAQQQQNEVQNKRKDKELGLTESQVKAQIDKEKLATQKIRNELAAQHLDQYYKTGILTEEAVDAMQDSVIAPTYRSLKAMQDKAFGVISEYQNIEDPQELIQYINKPETLEIVNAAMGNEIYSREKQSGGNKYEIVALEPMPGGVTPILKITTPDGKVVTERAPATKNKSSSSDDQVMVVPINQLKAKIVDGFNFVDVIDQHPELAKQFKKPKELTKLGKGDRLIDPTTNKVVVDNVKSSFTDMDKKYADYVKGINSANAGAILKDSKQPVFSRQEWEAQISGNTQQPVSNKPKTAEARKQEIRAVFGK